MIESESVVARGVRRTTWWIFVDREWLHIAQFEHAQIQSLPTAPGLVWSRKASVEVLAGTLLARDIREPTEPRTLSPLAYVLSSGRRVTWSRKRTTYRVDARGTLQRLRTSENE